MFSVNLEIADIPLQKCSLILWHVVRSPSCTYAFCSDFLVCRSLQWHLHHHLQRRVPSFRIKDCKVALHRRARSRKLGMLWNWHLTIIFLYYPLTTSPPQLSTTPSTSRPRSRSRSTSRRSANASTASSTWLRSASAQLQQPATSSTRLQRRLAVHRSERTTDCTGYGCQRAWNYGLCTAQCVDGSGEGEGEKD